MGKRKILGVSALGMAAVGVALRETIGVAVSKLASAMFRDDFAESLGAFVTFTLADVVILLLLGVGLVSLFWPWVSRRLQTEIERRSLFSEVVERDVYVNCKFEKGIDARFLSKRQRTVFVDSTLFFEKAALADCFWDDGYRLEFTTATVCSAEQLNHVRKAIPTIVGGRFINSTVRADHLFITQSELNELTRGQDISGKLVDFDPENLKPKIGFWGNAIERVRNSRDRSK